MKFAARLATTTALVTLAGSAIAADIVIVPPPPAPIPVIIEDPAFTGPYWGVYGGVGSRGVRGQPLIGAMVGTQFGYNFAANSLRFGFEVETEYYRVNPTVVDATLNGRAGIVLGSNILLYGQAGIGTFVNIPIWAVGGGVELAVGTNLALFVEGKAMWFMGGGPGIDAWTVRGGVNYYADPSNLSPTGNFDWGGLYFGAHGGVVTGAPILGHFGVQVGYNLGGGPFIAGVEVETSHTFAPVPLINAALNGRAGFAFGSILLYGEAGIGSYIGTPIWTAGGGAELALGNNLGLFAEAKAAFVLGGGGPIGAFINGGVNIHFGR